MLKTLINLLAGEYNLNNKPNHYKYTYSNSYKFDLACRDFQEQGYTIEYLGKQFDGSTDYLIENQFSKFKVKVG